MSANNFSLNFQEFLAHSDKPWDWCELSKIAPFHYVVDHPDLPWDWSELSKNVPFQYVLDHPDLSWTSNGLSRNPTVPSQFVLNRKPSDLNELTVIISHRI